MPTGRSVIADYLELFDARNLAGEGLQNFRFDAANHTPSQPTSKFPVGNVMVAPNLELRVDDVVTFALRTAMSSGLVRCAIITWEGSDQLRAK